MLIHISEEGVADSMNLGQVVKSWFEQRCSAHRSLSAQEWQNIVGGLVEEVSLLFIFAESGRLN